MSSSHIWSKAILDADFAIKLGRIKKYKVIEELLPIYVKRLFIHEYVYSNEILTPRNAKEQIDKLIAENHAEVVNGDTISALGAISVALYEDTIEKLRKEKRTRENGSHWGEIVSIAFAQTTNIPYFLSDESDQQIFINHNFVTPIQVIRIEDLVSMIKSTGGKRRDALLIWTLAGYSKRRFNSDLWPKQ